MPKKKVVAKSKPIPGWDYQTKRSVTAQPVKAPRRKVAPKTRVAAGGKLTPANKANIKGNEYGRKQRMRTRKK